MKEIRILVELAVPAWHSGLTQKQSMDIERVQKVAYIILSNCNTGKSPFNYRSALDVLNIWKSGERIFVLLVQRKVHT